MVVENSKEWNLILQLQEKMDKADKKIDEISLKIGIIQTMIRDYNGLKERIDVCESRLDKYDARREGENKLNKSIWERLGYVTGLIGAAAALMALILI